MGRQIIKDGVVAAPHALAAEAGAEVLRAGGNAVEAMVAAAATIAVVYPHMNSIGGDGFWLISEPGKTPVGIDACGPAATAATGESYRERGHDVIPSRGPLAALTVPGTVGGWKAALELAQSWDDETGRKGLDLATILERAIIFARDGYPVTAGQQALTVDKCSALEAVPGFADCFLPGGVASPAGSIFRQPDLAATLEQLAKAGLDDFYRGDLARALANGLEAADSPLRLRDLEAFAPIFVEPLCTALSVGAVYNMPPPTQGISSLMILSLFDRLGVTEAEGFAHIHGLVEATKQAFLLRNAHVTDPAHMAVDVRQWLEPAYLDALAGKIDRTCAMPWPHDPSPGDTIWMGAADKEGRVVSFIQSTYWEFGSGLVPRGTGVVMQNRGTSFVLDRGHPNVLMPGKRPFHTLNPALARLSDGRVMAYGTMGGEGQPQTQSAFFSRHALFGQPLQAALDAPRWLLGKTWGEETSSLKLENRFDPALVEQLKEAGHHVEMLEPMTSTMGHAGAVSVAPDGSMDGGHDPRSDGKAVFA
nr:gamma-glutamyltransferase family protein [uncultured Cohaesibacter sp.]